MKTISFSILFSTLQLFFNPLFFPFLQQFRAGENLRVAGDSTGRRRILTTLDIMSKLRLDFVRHNFGWPVSNDRLLFAALNL